MVKREIHDESNKPQFKYRMCIDYRKINKVSKGDAFRIPNIDQMLNRLQNAKYDLRRSHNFKVGDKVWIKNIVLP